MHCKSDSDDSYDDAIDDMVEEKGKADWRIYQLRKIKKSPENKMSKKARRLAKAKAGKMEAHSKVSNAQMHSKSKDPAGAVSNVDGPFLIIYPCKYEKTE